MSAAPGPSYVKQTILHDPQQGQHGNCLSAVLASLLGLPIEDVPVFADTDTWRRDLNAWLRPFGLAYLELQAGATWMTDFGIEGLHHELYGTTRRSEETLHACCALDGDLVFDPHPDGTGLVSQEGLSIFIALRPWEARAASAAGFAVNPRLTRPVVTENPNPPGLPGFAWSAIFEGYELGDSVGHGRTEQEAIDWLIAEEAHLIATEHDKEKS